MLFSLLWFFTGGLRASNNDKAKSYFDKTQDLIKLYDDSLFPYSCLWTPPLFCIRQGLKKIRAFLRDGDCTGPMVMGFALGLDPEKVLPIATGPPPCPRGMHSGVDNVRGPR